jgi:hypothetical protein
MARGLRNYQAEYARRKAAGVARGLTLRQARGHPRAGEASVTVLKHAGTLGGETRGGTPDTLLQRYYRVVARLATGEPLRQATRAEHISWRTVTRLNEERVLYGYFYRTGRRGQSVFAGYWVRIWAHMPLLTRDGVYHPQIPLDKLNASLVGIYWNAVDEALRGRVEALQPFSQVIVYDALGTGYRLETNVNALYRYFDAMSDEAHAEFDRTFYRGREVLYASIA